MSFLKNLKSLFVTSDEEFLANEAKAKGKTLPKKKKNQVDIAENTVPAKLVITNSKDKGAGEVNQKFLEILLGAMSENNQEGYDYLEFKQSLQLLKKIESNEEKRFKTAYLSVKSLGVTPERFIETGKIYLKVLQNEQNKFLQSLSSQKELKIDQKQAELNGLDDWIVEKRKEIEKIEAEIKARIASKDKLQSQLNRASNKIKKVNRDFNASYEMLIGQIKSDLEKINKYLKE